MSTSKKAHVSNHPVPNSSFKPPIPSTPLNKTQSSIKKKGAMLFGKQEENNMTTQRKANSSNHPVPNSSFKPPIPSIPLNKNPKLHPDTRKTSNLNPKRLKSGAQTLSKGYYYQKCPRIWFNLMIYIPSGNSRKNVFGPPKRQFMIYIFAPQGHVDHKLPF